MPHPRNLKKIGDLFDKIGQQAVKGERIVEEGGNDTLWVIPDVIAEIESLVQALKNET
jgi:hypothetical protein